MARYIYEGDGSGYWDISLDFLTPVERNENALSGNLFSDKLRKRNSWHRVPILHVHITNFEGN